MPVQKRSQDRVDKVLEATAALLQEMPISDITTEDIAERANVPIGSIYHYFENKLGIFAELLRQTMLRADAFTIQFVAEAAEIMDVTELVDRTVDVAMEAYRREPGYAQMLRQFRPTPEFKQIADNASERVADALALHPLVENAPAGSRLVIARTVVEAANAMQRLAFEAERPGDAVDYIREMKLMLVAYLKSRLAPSAGGSAGSGT